MISRAAFSSPFAEFRAFTTSAFSNPMSTSFVTCTCSLSFLDAVGLALLSEQMVSYSVAGMCHIQCCTFSSSALASAGLAYVSAPNMHVKCWGMCSY